MSGFFVSKVKKHIQRIRRMLALHEYIKYMCGLLPVFENNARTTGCSKERRLRRMSGSCVCLEVKYYTRRTKSN